MTVLNSPGTIDSDYRGEVQVLLVNLGTEPFEILRAGCALPRWLSRQLASCQVEEIKGATSTKRGAGGFGSTGTKIDAKEQTRARGAEKGQSRREVSGSEPRCVPFTGSLDEMRRSRGRLALRHDTSDL